MIVLAVVLLGYISYDRLGVDLFPDLNNPKLFIELQSGERPPEEIEEQFVEELEALAIRQTDVVEVSSVSKTGSAQITIEYAWNTDMDDAFLELQKATNSYSQSGDIDEFTITQHDPNTSPIMLIGLSNPAITEMSDLRKVAENYIRNELVRLQGVAEVEIAGSEEVEILIETNDYMLDAFGLSLDDISGRIQNYNQSVSGGSIEELGTQYVVKGVGLLENVEDFENVIVGYQQVDSENEESSFAPVYLREVATVRINTKDPETIVRLNGERCLGLSIYKDNNVNTVNAIDEIDAAIQNLEKALPGYEMTVVTNQGSFIDDAISEVEESALLGILLAVFIIFIFLRRIGSTIIISIAIPISIIATFNLMYFNDLTLNIMTLGGLALGAGLLVDNAIVVLESIFRTHEKGMSIREAAVEGTAQVSGAITASTITTIVVFLPIIYLHGASGELFKDQAWTVAFSLVSSLFVAVLVIPMLVNVFYKNKKTSKKESVQVKGYGNFLLKILKMKWLVVLVAVVLLGVAALMVTGIGMEFMPKTETKEFDIEVAMTEGTKLERTSSALANLEQIVNDMLGDDLKVMYTHVGPTSESSSESAIFEGTNTGEIKIILSDETDVTSTAAIQALSEAFGDIPGMEITFKQNETALKSILGTDESPLVIEVKGEDLDVIDGLVADVMTHVEGIEGIYNIESSMEDGAPEVEIFVDRMKAGIYNVGVSNIVSQIQTQLEGTSVGEIEREGEMQDITLKLPEKSLSDLEDMVITSGDQEYMINELATISIGQSPKQINRRNQVRIGKITAELRDDLPLDQAAQKIEEALASMSFPVDYNVNITGQEEKRAESMQNLGFALLLSIVLVYMVMASQFESLLHPFTILLTIPLAVVGTVFTFFIMGLTFNIMAFIGLIMLVGIAVNNSILLVDRTMQLRKDGLTRAEALVQAGQQRIRPIFMTSLTTILALLPLTIGIGESASLRSPMAIAVIGGLVTSTLLTLVVIPCVYEIFEGIKDRLKGVKE